MIVKKIIFFISIAGLAHCQSGNKNESNDKLNPGFSYAINKPAEIFEMGVSLQEISGLSVSEDGNILAVNDEQAKIFTIDRQNGSIIKTALFREDGGDFEGIEMVGDIIYAVKSKGKLYAIFDYNDQTKLRTESFVSDELSKAADVEGLGYDPVKKLLILGCKGPREQILERELWSFDPATKQFSTKPILTISYGQMHKWLAEHHADPDVFKDFANEAAAEFHFGISGFAVHPRTGNYFFLSSPGKILLVSNSEGAILNILRLDKKIHPQPEGIVFSSDGTLYISNEGKKEITPNICKIPEIKK
ncbi:MAG: SdiA-regulated domain-containing protein [Saprospiraceae bacterium]